MHGAGAGATGVLVLCMARVALVLLNTIVLLNASSMVCVCTAALAAAAPPRRHGQQQCPLFGGQQQLRQLQGQQRADFVSRPAAGRQSVTAVLCLQRLCTDAGQYTAAAAAAPLAASSPCACICVLACLPCLQAATPLSEPMASISSILATVAGMGSREVLHVAVGMWCQL
jgi:hypothetical protein